LCHSTPSQHYTASTATALCRVLLKAFTLKDEFKETIENLEDSVHIARKACDNLVHNLGVPLLFQFILNVGNTLNANNARLANASGITLDSLMALEGVETNVKGKKFLHWVAEQITDPKVLEEIERCVRA
jgi:hypothetical protein